MVITNNYGSARSASNHLTVVASPNLYATAVAKDSPSGYWPLNEASGAATAIDYSGAAHFGTNTGGITLNLANFAGDTTGPITANGAGVVFTASAAGQNGTLTFTGSVNQRVALNVSSDSIGTFAAGANTYVWDMRYPGPTVLPDAVFQGRAVGPLAAPGSYRAELTVNGKTMSQPFTIVRDPRLTFTDADLEAQQIARDPSYTLPSLDQTNRDLMYSDDYVAHNYNTRPTTSGTVAFWVFAVPLAMGGCVFFIWLIWFKRW